MTESEVKVDGCLASPAGLPDPRPGSKNNAMLPCVRNAVIRLILFVT